MRRFLRSNDGAAAIEFGLVAPILAMVLLSVVTMGGVILAYNKMRQAISSGAQYAMTVGADADAIRDVVLTSWDGMPADGDVTAVQACLCGNAAHACSSICDDGDYPERITTIHASMTYTSFVGASHAMSAEEKVRTR